MLRFISRRCNTPEQTRCAKLFFGFAATCFVSAKKKKGRLDPAKGANPWLA